ncbi:GNAT family N-acetyltransferase [Echinicola strongylocentroti]|uniref:GNAT family N-acetyltransferase n=1 Tax=Echinicola strongylocentroti TaxID=1795355 RepID=UPI0013A6911F|nr:GNAT family N-acetyltransferase [Echinicola strongylocentroti]
MRSYKVLNKQSFTRGEFQIVPIRFEDRFKIMKWRNEQIYHLRQSKRLTKEDQDVYFSDVVEKLFDQEMPGQILFSFLKEGICIGYGGLVHINWIDRNAEISFIMKTSLEKKDFEFHWASFLSMIEKVAFDQLGLHKIFTYAFDLRPRLYTALEGQGFVKEAVLEEHCFFENSFIDVVIHAKIQPQKALRNATSEDVDLTFKWANDAIVRKYSYNQEPIERSSHDKWFRVKILSNDCEYYVLELNNEPVGSIRFDIESLGRTAKISYLVDSGHTGKGLGKYLLKEGVNRFRTNMPGVQKVYGYVLKENTPSVKIFQGMGYKKDCENESEIKFELTLS